MSSSVGSLGRVWKELVVDMIEESRIDNEDTSIDIALRREVTDHVDDHRGQYSIPCLP